jgi:hypothetical protein
VTFTRRGTAIGLDTIPAPVRAALEQAMADAVVQAIARQRFDVTRRPAAVRAGSPEDEAWIEAQLQKRRRWYARVAAALGMDPDEAARRWQAGELGLVRNRT